VSVRRFTPVIAVLALATVGLFSPADARSTTPHLHLFTVKLKGATQHSEPRIAVDPHGRRWVVTNDAKTNDEIVYVSKYGRRWRRTKTEPAGQNLASIDTDIITLPTGRIISSELDYAGINFVVSYSDDGGKTWTESRGQRSGDTDREWLAPGPHNRVYLLYHNLASGEGNHNMYVETSTDGGATFGPPVPVTLPGSRAFLDLQCADSGGPSNIFANQVTRRVYAVWGSRSSAVGGCGAQPPEANVVAATEVWVATSPDGSPGSWTDHLAVDDSKSGKIVGMQLSPGTLDTGGNVYVSYPESMNGYPDYHGGAVKYVWAPADLSHWSKPVTVHAAGGAGNILVHVIAGSPGKLDFAYFHGVKTSSRKPLWYTTVSQVTGGITSHPRVQTVLVSRIATAMGSAAELMGTCSNPGGGFTCGRSADVWGIALTGHCKLTITWPTEGDKQPHANLGTFVSTQDGGRTICSKLSGAIKPAR
jgi:hypothetical protein